MRNRKLLPDMTSKNPLGHWTYIGFVADNKNITQCEGEIDGKIIKEVLQNHKDCKFKFIGTMYFNKISGIDTSKLCVKSYKESRKENIIIYIDPGLILNFLNNRNIADLEREHFDLTKENKVYKRFAMKRLSNFEDYYYIESELKILKKRDDKNGKVEWIDKKIFDNPTIHYKDAIIILPETSERIRILSRLIIEKQLGAYIETDKYAF